jgi:hypothetical protein
MAAPVRRLVGSDQCDLGAALGQVPGRSGAHHAFADHGDVDGHGLPSSC